MLRGWDVVMAMIVAFAALLLLVLFILVWSTGRRPARFRLSLKVWRLLSFELESDPRKK